MAEPLQADIDAAVREFVSLASGLDFDTQVIPGNDSSPAPNGSYASVLEITKIGRGIDSETAIDGPTSTEATLKHKGARSIIYSVQFYRTGAADYAEGLLSYAATSPGQFFLAQNNLTWGIAGDVRNLDAIMDSAWEGRRSVDITFKYQSRRQIDINKIGSVEIDFELSDSTDLEESLEVTDA